MSATGIFIVGLIVTLVVGAAVALLIYGAIMDGREQTRVDVDDLS